MTSLACSSCGKPAERTFDDDFQHESLDDGLACTVYPVRWVSEAAPHFTAEPGSWLAEMIPPLPTLSAAVPELASR